GLQVGVIEGFSASGSPVINTRNSGAARTYGVDLDLQYRPQAIEGLTLNASINWNNAHYKELQTLGCYANQTVAQGCNLNPVPVTPTATNPATVRYQAQNLNGAQMIRAPEWSGTFGFTYEFPVSSGWKLQFSNNN